MITWYDCKYCACLFCCIFVYSRLLFEIVLHPNLSQETWNQDRNARKRPGQIKINWVSQNRPACVVSELFHVQSIVSTKLFLLVEDSQLYEPNLEGQCPSACMLLHNDHNEGSFLRLKIMLELVSPVWYSAFWLSIQSQQNWILFIHVVVHI